MTEPAFVTTFRTMLLACASVTSAGITTGRFYYPKAAAAADDSTTPAVKPYAVLAETSHRRAQFMEPSVLGLPSGTLTAAFHFDSDIGAVEDFCRNVCSELMIVTNGLNVLSASTELSSEPTPGMYAADQDVTTALEIVATVTVEWGLS